MLRHNLEVLVVCFVLLGAACGAQTSGRIVEVAWQVDKAAHATFETDSGYELQLEEARLGIGAAYAYAPLEDKLKATAWRWLTGVSVAHAHGGLDAETGRRVRAELLESVVVDLLDPEPQALPPIAAEAGAIDAVKLELAKSGAAAHESLHGGSAFLRGRAQRDGTTLRFQAVVALDAALKARSIDLTGLSGTLDEGAVLHVRVDPAVWLEHAAFDRLAPADSEEVVEISADSQIGRALAIGVRSPQAIEAHVKAD
jgi:hypothetical protein